VRQCRINAPLACKQGVKPNQAASVLRRRVVTPITNAVPAISNAHIWGSGTGTVLTVHE